jgi:lysophospholipase L1-like esterase
MSNDHAGNYEVIRQVALAMGCSLLFAFGGCRRNPAVSPDAVKIMPLGDSITQGEHQHPSYRRPLWMKLKSAGYKVDFVGSLKKQNFGGGRKDFDRDHEGRWGWPVEAVLEQADSWIAANTPDIALVHLGTNDLLSEETAEITVERLFGLVDVLRRHNPKVTVLLATLIPPAHPDLRDRIVQFNDVLKEALPGHQGETSRVVLVDQFEGYRVSTDTYDGIHPNEAGAEKIAHKWFEALEKVLSPESGVAGPVGGADQ